MPHHGLGPIRFASYLALAWLGLVVYGSLHPFAGWRDTGVSPFAFLEGGWPRYWTVFDLAANVAVYLPLGFFLGLALSRLRGRFTGMALATLLAGAISFGLESVQTWLPSRVPSNLDLACNTLGGLLGALWAQAVGPRVLLRITALEHKLIAPVPHAELGLTLLGLWLLVPLSPETLLFGAGDLRQMFALTGAVPFAAESFVMIEASITAFNVLAVGLIVRMLCARLAIAYLITPLFLLLCLVVATLSAAIRARAAIIRRGVAGSAMATSRMAVPTVRPSWAPGVSQASASSGLTRMAADRVATTRQSSRKSGVIR
jgi:VanZ family protein